MGEGRGAAATSHGHKLAMVSKTTLDSISFETSSRRLKSNTFFETLYKVETLRSAMLRLNNFR